MIFYPDAINNETIKIMHALVNAGYLVSVEEDGGVLCIDINGPATAKPKVTYTSNSNVTNFKTTLDDF